MKDDGMDACEHIWILASPLRPDHLKHSRSAFFLAEAVVRQSSCSVDLLNSAFSLFLVGGKIVGVAIREGTDMTETQKGIILEGL